MKRRRVSVTKEQERSAIGSKRMKKRTPRWFAGKKNRRMTGMGRRMGSLQRERLEKKRKKPDETAEEGIRRLAFGDIRDAVRLLYTTSDDIEILDSLDLYTVSELKRGKDGQLEMKFYDRLKALQYLMEAENGREHEESRPLYEALKESALLLSEKYRGKDGNVQEPQKENGKNED